MYLLDTNVVSESTRPRPNPRALAWLAARREVILSIITIEELAYGVASLAGSKRARLAAWLEALTSTATRILDITPAIARASGDLRAARERAGARVAQPNMLIAATAVVHGLTLATRNLRDFDGCGVALVDPFSS